MSRRKNSVSADAEKIKKSISIEYPSRSHIAEKLVNCLKEQFSAILTKNEIALGVPMESRIKTLSSIEGKVERKPDKIKTIEDVNDLAGIRMILLFRDDVEKLDRILKDQLDVMSYEDVSNRLTEDQFGYQSNHYIIKIPESWASLPSYADLRDQVAEIQVRTIAQHMWAAASHKLQYKRESSVPAPLRRTISRVSALLEIVDLEFSRVLAERDAYLLSIPDGIKIDQPLNVDLLSKILNEKYPKKNMGINEKYDEVLGDLKRSSVNTAGELIEIIDETMARVMASEQTYVAKLDLDEVENVEDENRFYRGVYFTHCGLARSALGFSLSDKKS